ncbi:hypothetical protein HPP92_023439 [Vanilla planifolia]|uniref:Uncharacterized protein n=1 Tax=Vanilla planifolia TaxID=51239 RepID=A0A835PTY5_VANPL|nr:hypothetical protein HPP92_023731 [Vanilla planifolia]KAG0460311.1 hypothetical protein HPP92_023439 [Vanilla planifolia]
MEHQLILFLLLIFSSQTLRVRFLLPRNAPSGLTTTSMHLSYLIFDEHINEGDIHWAQKPKMKEKKQELAVSKAENVELQADYFAFPIHKKIPSPPPPIYRAAIASHRRLVEAAALTG